MKRTASLLALILALGITDGMIQPLILYGQQIPDPRVADLIRAGRVRVGLFTSPLFATKDPATGELGGMGIEIARALATRLRVEVLAVEFPSAPKVLEGLKAGACDVAFLGIDPARAADVDFSPPYMQVEYTFLVPAGSSIRTVADADQPGVRIALVGNGVSDLALSRMLKRAELIRTGTEGADFDLLRSGKADVLAGSRPALLEYSAQLSGSRVLEDRFRAIFIAMAVPKDQAGRLAYIGDFIEEAKASGVVQRAIERAGLRGVQVAPPGNPKVE